MRGPDSIGSTTGLLHWSLLLLSKTIVKEISHGIKAGSYLEVPCDTFVWSQIVCFWKKHSNKFMVIHDLSYPLGLAINEFIDINNYHIHYLSQDDVSEKKCLDQGTLLAKLDLEDAFKSIQVWE